MYMTSHGWDAWVLGLRLPRFMSICIDHLQWLSGRLPPLWLRPRRSNSSASGAPMMSRSMTSLCRYPPTDVQRENKKTEPELSVLCKARLESHLDIDQLAMCARAFVEKHVSVYSLAVVCCEPVNHRLRHTLSNMKYLSVFCLSSSCNTHHGLFSPQDYIAVKEKYAKYLPHSGGRYAAKRFRKAQCPIVERLTNSMMMHGRNNGKKLMTVRIVKHAFEIIHLLTGEVWSRVPSVLCPPP